MFGSTSRGIIIDYGDVKLVLICLVVVEYNWFYLKLGFVAFDSTIDFNTQIYSSIHFYMIVFKHKSLLVRIILNQNQFFQPHNQTLTVKKGFNKKFMVKMNYWSQKLPILTSIQVNSTNKTNSILNHPNI